MSKQAKQALAALEHHGYAFDHRNAKGLHVYAKGNGPDIAVNLGMNENAARSLIRRLDRDAGVEQECVKRNPAQVKARQAAERDRAAAAIDRLEQERAHILARRDEQLNGHGARLTRSEVRAIEKRIEQIDREHKRLTALMTQTATSGAHGGTRRAQHQTGVQ